jgi:uncharacterized protein YeeX (DUF496 family)
MDLKKKEKELSLDEAIKVLEKKVEDNNKKIETLKNTNSNLKKDLEILVLRKKVLELEKTEKKVEA